LDGDDCIRRVGLHGGRCPSGGTVPVEDENHGSVTSLVAIINPIVNMGHATGVTLVLGAQRDGIPIDANPGSAATSKAGLAMVSTGTGAVELHIGNGLLEHSVLVAGNAYDATIAYDGSSVSYFQEGGPRTRSGRSRRSSGSTTPSWCCAGAPTRAT
jgi:hypothetical protein